MRHITRPLLVAFATLAIMAGTAYAQPADPADAGAASDVEAGPVPGWVDSAPTPAETAQADPVGTAVELVANLKAKDWRGAVALGLGLLMIGLGYVRKEWKPAARFFSGDRGGAILVALLGIAGTISAALATDVPIDWRLFAGAMLTTFTAVGGYTWIKRIWNPKDKA